MLIRLLHRLIGRIWHPKTKKRKKGVHFEYVIGPVSLKQTKERHMIELVITNEEKVQVTLKPVTSSGKPAKLDGTPTWAVTTGSATLEVASDGLSAFLISPDEPGESLVNVEADADLGEGVVTIADAIKLTVNGALATSLGLSAATPVPK